MRLADKRKAIELRKQGFTYNEIRQIISNLSKGTLSGWLKNIELTKGQEQRIINKIIEAASRVRVKGAWMNKKNGNRGLEIFLIKQERNFPSLLQSLYFLWDSVYIGPRELRNVEGFSS